MNLHNIFIIIPYTNLLHLIQHLTRLLIFHMLILFVIGLQICQYLGFNSIIRYRFLDRVIIGCCLNGI